MKAARVLMPSTRQGLAFPPAAANFLICFCRIAQGLSRQSQLLNLSDWKQAPRRSPPARVNNSILSIIGSSVEDPHGHQLLAWAILQVHPVRG